jgi:DNA-binding NarL/FixJ family response regulator
MAIRLLVADDHEVVRSGLRSLVTGTDIKVVAEAGTGEDALRAAGQHDLDVVLLDIRMPDGDGLATLAKLRKSHPNLAVLMLTTYDNPTYVARAVALGASGYVLKGSKRDKLLETIRQAARGEQTWSREDLRRVSGAAGARVNSDLEAPLTPRETEVLAQLAHGLTNKEIGQALAISTETVKEHVQNILKKIGVTDRTQAAVWAVRAGLV